MNTSNVAAGKPKLTGSVYSAPLGTEIPTDAKTPLGDEFVDMGYSADDGLVKMM